MKNLSLIAASGSILCASAAWAQWGANGSSLFYSVGNVGVGTNNPLFPVHTRTASEARSIFAENLAPTGTTFGVWAQSAGTSGRGLFGWATAPTGQTYGVVGQSNSTLGRGVLGWATAATGNTTGVLGQSASTKGRGVLGWATATSGQTYGVWGESASTSGTGVYGRATANGDVAGVRGFYEGTSSSGIGVQAYSSTGKALFASVEDPGAYAGFFLGGRNFFEGRVGIGTPDPAEMLHVAGNIRVPNTAVIGGVVANFNTGSLTIQAAGQATHHGIAYDGGVLTLAAGACNKSHGGTPPPTGTSSGNDVVVRAGDNVFGAIGSTVWNGNIRFIAGDAASNGGSQPERLRIVGDTGNVGIGTTSPGSFRLAVNGTAAKPGGGSWSVFSDARLKTNVEPMRGTLDRLLSLRGYTFEYLPQAIEQRLALPGPQIGLLAQEVERVFPDWVSDDESGYKHVTERATTALMVEALRDLRAEKDRQLAERDAQIGRVRDENAELRARLDRLEERVEGLLGRSQ